MRLRGLYDKGYKKYVNEIHCGFSQFTALGNLVKLCTIGSDCVIVLGDY